MSPSERPLSFFIPGLNGGGAQKVIVNLVNALIEQTSQPIHLVLARAQGEFLNEVRPEVTIINLGSQRALKSIRPLARYLKQVKPQVLCSSLNYANVCATLAWQWAGRPCRLVLREDTVVQAPQGRLQTLITQQLMRRLYPQADTLVAISSAVAQSLIQHKIVSPEKLEVIGNPVVINPTASEDLATLPFRLPVEGFFVAVGRLAEEKGFDTLIDAFAQTAAHHNYPLIVLGEGPQRAALEAQVKRLGLTDRIQLPGFIQQPERVLSKAKVFVLSSRWEGFGLALVEALALGLPIVATRCPGAPQDILKDGELGHLVPVNDPQALAAAMLKALYTPRASRPCRQQRAEEFAAPRIARQYLETVLSPFNMS